MPVSLRKNGLTSLFKEVRVFNVIQSVKILNLIPRLAAQGESMTLIMCKFQGMKN